MTIFNISGNQCSGKNTLGNKLKSKFTRPEEVVKPY